MGSRSALRGNGKREFSLVVSSMRGPKAPEGLEGGAVQGPGGSFDAPRPCPSVLVCLQVQRIWLTSGSATKLSRFFSVGSGLDLVSHRADRDRFCPRRVQSLPHFSLKAAWNQPAHCPNLDRYLPKPCLIPGLIPSGASPNSAASVPGSCPEPAQSLPRAWLLPIDSQLPVSGLTAES